MKMTLNSSILLLAALSVTACSKSVRSTGQPSDPTQLGSAPGQVTAPKPQPSLTPTSSPTVQPSPGSSSSPAPTTSSSPSPAPSASVSPSPSPSSSGTTGSATGDAIKAKYETAVLRCDLEFPVAYGYGKLGVETLGSATFSWDLIKDYSDQKKFELNAKNFRKDLIVDFNIQSVTMEQSVTIPTGDGGSETLENTPVIKGTYNYQSASPISFFRMQSSVSGNGPLTFYEGTDSTLVDEAVEAALGNASEAYGVLIDCAFETKLKSTTTTATVAE